MEELTTKELLAEKNVLNVNLDTIYTLELATLCKTNAYNGRLFKEKKILKSSNV